MLGALAALGLAAPPTSTAASPPAAPPAPAAGAAAASDTWTPLFDGKTLNGWHGDMRHWLVENGDLVGRSTTEIPLDHSIYLVRDGTFGDFELHCQFKINGGNSGIQYRSVVEPGKVDITGYQSDMDAADSYTGILYEGNGRAIMTERGESAIFGPSGRKVIAKQFGKADELAKAIKRGEWNDYRLVIQGERMRHEINGVLMSETRDRDLIRARRDGIIAIQLHQGPPMEVRYRDFKIKALDAGPPSEPEWIWSRDHGKDGEKCILRTSFEMPDDARSATLRATADNHFRAFLDGKEVLRGDDWARLYTKTLEGGIAKGRHELAIECTNDGDGAAMTALLQAGPWRVVTDGTWEAIDSAWPPPSGEAGGAAPHPVFSFGPTSERRGPWSDPFAQKAAPPATALTAPPGFAVELLHSAQPGEGSWASMTFDDKGRIYISPQYGELMRFTLPPLQGPPQGPRPGEVTVERVPTEIGFAQGLAWLDGRLFANVDRERAAGGGLWRIDDSNGDGMPDHAVRLTDWGIDSEHGPHGIVVGPDKKLWVANGNHTPVPTHTADSPLAHWGEDLPLGRVWDPRGHAVGIMAPGGLILRVDPEDGKTELIAGGLRNVYDLAFNGDGELFAYDADMEWDLGAPWYRPPRLCHIVSGGDYGWRSGSGKWPAWYLDSLPAAVDTDLSSPTGMAFGGKSSYPQPWRSMIFGGDWAYGRILAFDLREDGSTYRGSWSPFLSGRPMPVTDFEFGPDGAMYVITGGRGTQSGLYRVRWTGEAPAGGAAAVAGGTDVAGTARGAAPPSAGHADAVAARQRRHALEAAHRAPDPAQLDAYFKALSSPDRFERHAARVALEHLPVQSYSTRATAMQNRGAPADRRMRLESLLAIVRTGNHDEAMEALRCAASQAIEPAREASPVASSREDRLALVRLAEVAVARHGPPSDAARTALLTAVDRWYPSGDFDLDRGLSELLLAVHAEKALDRTIACMEGAPDQQRGLHFAFALRDQKDGWTPELRGKYAEWIRKARSMGGGFSLAGYIEAMVKATEAAAGPLPGGSVDPNSQTLAGAANMGLHAAPSSTGFVKAWTVEDLQSALGEADRGRNFENGARVYRGASCYLCHRFAGEGGATGPDLTGIAKRFSRRDLLEAILEPSKSVADQYRDSVFEMKDGDVVAGRIVDEHDGLVVISTNPLGPDRETVKRAEIVKTTPLATSPMPQGLLDSRRREEILDLIAYLESGGDRNAPAFKPVR